MLETQNYISYLLIYSESKYSKQQCILAHVILDFAKNFERDGPLVITLLLKMSFACNSYEILPDAMKSHPQLCKQV